MITSVALYASVHSPLRIIYWNVSVADPGGCLGFRPSPPFLANSSYVQMADWFHEPPFTWWSPLHFSILTTPIKSWHLSVFAAQILIHVSDGGVTADATFRRDCTNYGRGSFKFLCALCMQMLVLEPPFMKSWIGHWYRRCLEQYGNIQYPLVQPNTYRCLHPHKH